MSNHTLLKDEVRRSGHGNPTGLVLDMLRSSGASDEAILKVLDRVAADLPSGMFDGEFLGFIEVSFDATPGAVNAIRATIDDDGLRNMIAAAAHKRLAALGHGHLC